MLPPGHIAGGFLTATAVLKILKPDLPAPQTNQLLWWGAFFSFAPDLDTFVSFANERAWFVKDPKNNHRKYLSHVPLLWLLTGLLIYFSASSAYIRILGLMLWLCSWSHFLLDSIEYGIMWLWPFNKSVFAIRNKGNDTRIESTGFTSYWLEFLKAYAATWTFYFEVLIILAALIISTKY
jgi:membrane-bound metal-dependent hydrolase YbcI (DUF457 family)